MAVITSGLVFYGCTGEREVRARALFFTSYFSSSRTPRVSPLVASISDHQSRLYYYFFPQSALISRPPRRLSPLLSLNSQPPPSSPHLFIHFSVLPSSSHSQYFSCKFFLSCFPAAPPHTHTRKPPNATNTPNAEPRFLCCVSSGGRRCLRLVRCDTGSDEVKGQLSRDTPLILSTRLSCDWGCSGGGRGGVGE